jgi:hypothetical protein
MDSQDAFVSNRSLQEHFAQRVAYHFHGMGFGPFCEFPPGFPFQTGQKQTLQRILRTSPQKIGMRMIGRNTFLIQDLPHPLQIALHPNPQNLLPFRPIQGQHPIRRNLPNGFLEIKEILIRPETPL